MLFNPTRLVYGAALASVATAQTFSACNPLKKSGCPDNVGLTKPYSIDFKAGGDDAAWKSTGNGAIKYSDKGAEFTISKPLEAPTLQSEWHIFYGRVEVLMRASPGKGIVSSAVLLSDTLDEVDWEWLGGVPNEVQTNYFGKGNTASDNTRDTKVAVADTQGKTHNYTMDWTEEYTKWYIDGAEVRTLNKADAHGGQQYPQTPMRVKLGSWAGGDPGNAPGTIEWAGGESDYNGLPYIMLVEKVSVTNYNPAEKYSYSDSTGDSKSIKFSKAAGGSDDKAKKDDKKEKEDKKKDEDKHDKTSASASASSTKATTFTTATSSSSASTSDSDESSTTATTTADAKSSSSAGSSGGVHFESKSDKASASETGASSSQSAEPVKAAAAAASASNVLMAGAAAAVAAFGLF